MHFSTRAVPGRLRVIVVDGTAASTIVVSSTGVRVVQVGSALAGESALSVLPLSPLGVGARTCALISPCEAKTSAPCQMQDDVVRAYVSVPVLTPPGS